MNALDRELVSLIRESLPPLSQPPSTIDLWPQLRRRLDDRRTTVGKLDWLMVALVLALLAGFPESVLLVLFNL